MIFTKRIALSRLAMAWCHARNIPAEPFNVVTALFALGHLKADSVSPSPGGRGPG
jgi:hypothetical protein